ncbi:MAG: carboxymuconolactone decarboxylase family protein [Gammaproteobacteria bacterium]|nr:carboxymuconolactone decarboxylase family protein [Gammaproteobacteria bacterium]
MSDELYDKGMEVRRAVLGDSYVDKALAVSDAFTDDLQQFVTAHCWGTVWQREGLSRKTRSLLTLALLTSLRATTELQGHVRGALRNGCTVDEIREALLHAAVYCGVPAGIEAFRAARPVIEAWENGERE